MAVDLFISRVVVAIGGMLCRSSCLPRDSRRPSLDAPPARRAAEGTRRPRSPVTSSRAGLSASRRSPAEPDITARSRPRCRVPGGSCLTRPSEGCPRRGEHGQCRNDRHRGHSWRRQGGRGIAQRDNDLRLKPDLPSEGPEWMTLVSPVRVRGYGLDSAPDTSLPRFQARQNSPKSRWSFG